MPTNVSSEPENYPVLRWARQNGLRYYYTVEPGLTGRCLKVLLGHVTAYFRAGKLVRLWVHADGEYLDEVFFHLAQLFGLCVQTDGYLPQEVVPTAAESRTLLLNRR